MKINDTIHRILTLELKNEEIDMFKFILTVASNTLVRGTQEDQLLQSLRSYLEEV